MLFEIEHYEKQLKVPIKLANGVLMKREGFYLHFSLNNQEIITEVAPLPGWSQESVNQTYKQLVSLQELTLDRVLSQTLYPSVAFGIESAMLRINHSLFSYKVEHYSLHTPQSLGSDGICKFKVTGLSVGEAIDSLQKCLAKYPHLKFRLDVNQRWSLAEALEFFKHFSLDNFDYIEEPCREISELIQFAHQTNCPIAIDEKLLIYPKEDWLQIPSLKAVVIKPTLFGGFLRCKKLVKTLPSKIQPVFSSCFETEVGLSQIALYASCLTKNNQPHGLDTAKYF